MTAKFAALALMLGLGLAQQASARDDVTFPSADGTPLTGFLYRPDGPAPFGAVIMMHGCSGMLTKSGRLTRREAGWADILKREGYVVLIADSFNPRGVRSICSIRDRPIQPYRERPHDAYGALLWLQAQPFVDPRKVVLMGWSNGAMSMLWTVKDDAKQRPKDLKIDFAAAVGFYPGCIKVLKSGVYLPAVPVLLQIGLADNWTLPKPCLRLVEQANALGAAMEVDAYKGAYHAFDHPNLKTRTRTTRHSGYRSGKKTVRIGTNHTARRAAIDRVKGYLGRFLRN